MRRPRCIAASWLASGCWWWTTPATPRRSGLVAADGDHPINLDLLTPAEARKLLARLGPDRVTAEPDSVEEIITRCARLPLALTIVEARAAIQPHVPAAAPR